MRDFEIKPYPGKGFEASPEDKGWVPLNVPTELNVNTTKLVVKFAEALLDKLLKSQKKYGYQDEWAQKGWMHGCRTELELHRQKGDPVDVAAYCAFLWHHGEPTIVKD